MFAAQVPAWLESFGLQVSGGSPFAVRSTFRALSSAASKGSVGGEAEVLAKPHEASPRPRTSVTITAADRLFRNLFARMPHLPKSQLCVPQGSSALRRPFLERRTHRKDVLRAESEIGASGDLVPRSRRPARPRWAREGSAQRDVEGDDQGPGGP